MQELYLNKRKNWLMVVSIALIIFAIILALCFFMRGETIVSGEWATEKTGSLVCEITELEYPFFEYDNSYEKKIRINSTLKDDNIETISLMYTLKYDNEKSIIDSENLNHLAMNKSFTNDRLEFDALGLKFSKFSNGLQMSLFAKYDDNVVAKYFMLDGANSGSSTEAQKLYEKQGFTCQMNY